MIHQPTPPPPAPPAARVRPADLAYALSVPARVQQIRTIPKGSLYGTTVAGSCMVPAGLFDGDTCILRRRDHATDGQIVAAHYQHLPGLPWLGLKYYRSLGGRVRLVAADPSVSPVDRDPGQVEVLGVLVSVVGTLTLPPAWLVGCARHGRFLRPEACGVCRALASALAAEQQ